MKEREAWRYLEDWGLEPDQASERTRGHLSLRKTFGLTAVTVVSLVLLGLLSFLAFGRLETTVSQAQTVQTASGDNLAPAAPVATQDVPASDPPSSPTWQPEYPHASPECMGYAWYWIVVAFYAGPG